jgi:hypothetical protein
MKPTPDPAVQILAIVMAAIVAVVTVLAFAVAVG